MALQRAADTAIAWCEMRVKQTAVEQAIHAPDPFLCPDCHSSLPEKFRDLEKVVCLSCGQQECYTGRLVLPVAGQQGQPPKVIQAAATYWLPIPPAPGPLPKTNWPGLLALAEPLLTTVKQCVALLTPDGLGSTGGALFYRAQAKWAALGEAARSAGLLQPVIILREDPGDEDRTCAVRALGELLLKDPQLSIDLLDEALVRRLEVLLELLRSVDGASRHAEPTMIPSKTQPPLAQDSVARVAALREALDTWQRRATTFRSVMGEPQNPWQMLDLERGNAVMPSLDSAGQQQWRARELERAQAYAAARSIAEAVDAHGQAVAVLLERSGLNPAPLGRLLRTRDPGLLEEILDLLWEFDVKLAAAAPPPDADMTGADEAARGGGHEDRAGEGQYVFRKDGDIWIIQFGEESGRFPVPGNKGLKHVADLLSRPYRRLSGLDLQGLSSGPPRSEHSFQEVADDSAISREEQEARELAGRIEKARRDNNPAEVDRLMNELQELTQEIRRSQGLGKRKRRLGSASPEALAFEAVDSNIKRCYKKMQKHLPSLVSYLQQTIRPMSPGFMYVPTYDPLQLRPDWHF
jgi:hypothetical protein